MKVNLTGQRFNTDIEAKSLLVLQTLTKKTFQGDFSTWKTRCELWDYSEGGGGEYDPVIV